MQVPAVTPPARRWAHWRVPWWFVLLRTCGYRGRLHAWMRRECTARFPARRCPCGMYLISWPYAGENHASEKVQN